MEADLLKPGTWPAAVEGCTYVCHVASPFVFGVAEADEDTLIKPAVDGTLNVLKPCMSNEASYYLTGRGYGMHGICGIYTQYLVFSTFCLSEFYFKKKN